jgi:hypothetical protein
VVRIVSFVLAAVAVAAAIGFVTLYLGGYPAAFSYERLALVPLIAALSAALLHGFRRGNITRSTAAIGLISIVVWIIFLRMPF